MIKSIKNILIFSVFFPFIGIVQGIDIQPNSFLLLVSISFFLALKYKINKIFLINFLLVSLFFLIRIAFENGLLDAKYLLTYVVAILTPFTLYYLIKIKFILLTGKIVASSFALYVFVGLAQFFEPEFLVQLVSRSDDAIARLAESGRGKRSLTSEPSQLGQTLIYLNVLYIITVLTGQKKSLSSLVYYSFFSLCAVVIISQSFYSIFIYMLVLAALLFSLSPKKSIFSISVFLSIMFVYLNFFAGDESRVYRVYTSILEDPGWLLNQGAFKRVMNVPISLIGGWMHGPLGSGNTLEIITVNIYLPFFQVYYVADIGARNLGGLVELFLRFGVFSILPLTIALYMLYKIFIVKIIVKGRKMYVGLFFALTFVLTLFQHGSITDPLAWLAFIYAYLKLIEINKSSKYNYSS